MVKVKLKQKSETKLQDKLIHGSLVAYAIAISLVFLYAFSVAVYKLFTEYL